MQHVLQIPAVLDIAEPDKSQWSAQAIPGTPFADLFGTGTNFAEARKALAEVAAVAVIHGAISIEGLNPADLTAVRILATTRKTFHLTDLNTNPHP